MAATDTFRSIRVSLGTAAMAEELAARENRSMDEVFGEALHLYGQRLAREERLIAFSEESMRRNPEYSEEDIVRLCKEVRQEMYEERLSKKMEQTRA